MMDKWNINSQTVAAVVRLGVALVVSVFAMFGVDLDAGGIEDAVLAAASVVVLVWVWWRNNNVTMAAQEAQNVLDMVKAEQKIDECYRAANVDLVSYEATEAEIEEACVEIAAEREGDAPRDGE